MEELTDLLQAQGYEAARYHAGLSEKQRTQAQEDFQYDRVQLIVATNAFGMGIDKSNVSFVVHYNMPKSMEAYYQEAGRAGRDGSDARCTLLFSPQDMITGRWMINHSEPNPELTPQEYIQVRNNDLKRLQQMEAYATGGTCLRNSILQYFGQRTGAPCGNCGVCQRPTLPDHSVSEEEADFLPKAPASDGGTQVNSVAYSSFDRPAPIPQKPKVNKAP